MLIALQDAEDSQWACCHGSTVRVSTTTNRLGAPHAKVFRLQVLGLTVGISFRSRVQVSVLPFTPGEAVSFGEVAAATFRQPEK